uniref:Uncharacterized protein n=1 Tax=Klebsiella pneumoniae TaxID=573 RepID=A0A8B0SU84_KLEPN|nr:hypothetical protein [Klebsiella pneumoniae]
MRAVRREGVNEHGPVQMSGGEREIFRPNEAAAEWPGKKFIAKRPCRPPDSKTGCACLSPGEWTQTGDTGTGGKGAGTRRNDEERGRETALPRRVPAVLRRHGESGATGTVAASAAVDLDVRHQTLAAGPETACGFGGAYRVFFAVSGVWLDDRTAQLAGSRRCPVWVCFLKPLRFKKRHHSRGEEEEAGKQQAANREDAERKCGRRASAARFFPAPQARGLSRRGQTGTGAPPA